MLYFTPYSAQINVRAYDETITPSTAACNFESEAASEIETTRRLTVAYVSYLPQESSESSEVSDSGTDEEVEGLTNRFAVLDDQ